MNTAALSGRRHSSGDRRRRLVLDNLDRVALDLGEHRFEQAAPKGADLPA